MLGIKKLYQTVWAGINRTFGDRGLIALKVHWIVLLLGVFLVSCTAREPGFYSLRDPEIFRSPSPYGFHLVVVRLRDRRPLNEIRWQEGVYPPGEDLVGRIGKRVADHLEAAGIFNTVEYINIMVQSEDSALSDSAGDSPAGTLAGFSDRPSGRRALVLSSDLSHFSGKIDPEGNIEGMAGLENIRLTRILSGELVWEGSFLKELKRREKKTNSPHFYASEALRGVLNKLSMSLSLEKLALGGSDG